MDIHAPEGPTRSLKDFAIHILIVTIGILIALALEGIRETVHEHNLVGETRENFLRELEFNRKQLKLETANVRQTREQVDNILLTMPVLLKAPDRLKQQIRDLKPGFYFFGDTSWNAALPSGALTYMKTAELNRFETAFFTVRNYVNDQKVAQPQWIAIESYFQSRGKYSSQEVVEGEERLRAFQLELTIMEHGVRELSGDLDEALAKH